MGRGRAQSWHFMRQCHIPMSLSIPDQCPLILSIFPALSSFNVGRLSLLLSETSEKKAGLPRIPINPLLTGPWFSGDSREEERTRGHASKGLRMPGDRAGSQGEELCHRLPQHLLSSHSASSLTRPGVGPHTYLSHRITQVCQHSTGPVRG